MADEILDEPCPDCGADLIRVPEEDDANPRDGDAITCPDCVKTIRVER